MTALWIFLALSAGVTLGFFLCAALTMAAEQERQASRASPLIGLHPLESDSRV